MNGAGEEEEDEVFVNPTLKGTNKKPNTRQMKVIPALNNNHHKPVQPFYSLNTTHLKTTQLCETMSTHQPDNKQTLLSTSLPDSYTHAVTLTRSRSKSPSPRDDLKKKLKAKTLNPRSRVIQKDDLKRASSANSVFISFDTTHNISSPVHRPPDPIPHRGHTSGLHRGRAFKRKSVKDLRDIDGYYDVSYYQMNQPS